MLKLLTELLAITESKAQDSFMTLFEDLGTLKDLRLGSMIGALKQQYAKAGSSRGGGRRSETTYDGTSEVGNKLARGGYWGGGIRVGAESEIVDIAKVRDFADVRKALRDNDNAGVFAFYTQSAGENAIAILADPLGHIGTPTQYVGFAWDFSKTGIPEEKQQELLKLLAVGRRGGGGWNETDEVVKKSASSSHATTVSAKDVRRYDKEDRLKADGKAAKDHHDKAYTAYEDWVDAVNELSSGRFKVSIEKGADKNVAKSNGNGMVGEWDKKTGKGFIRSYKEPFNSAIEKEYGKEKNFVGVSVNVASVRNFVNALAKEVKLTGKVAMSDAKAMDKRKERNANPPIEPKDLKLFADDIKTRLSKYKNSKLETVEDAKAFFEKAMAGGLKKINLGGLTYIAKINETYTKASLVDALAGKTVYLQFDADRATSGYGELKIGVKIENGMLKLVSAEYSVNGKKVTEKF